MPDLKNNLVQDYNREIKKLEKNKNITSFSREDFKIQMLQKYIFNENLTSENYVPVNIKTLEEYKQIYNHIGEFDEPLEYISDEEISNIQNPMDEAITNNSKSTPKTYKKFTESSKITRIVLF